MDCGPETQSSGRKTVVSEVSIAMLQCSPNVKFSGRVPGPTDIHIYLPAFSDDRLPRSGPHVLETHFQNVLPNCEILRHFTSKINKSIHPCLTELGKQSICCTWQQYYFKGAEVSYINHSLCLAQCVLHHKGSQGSTTLQGQGHVAERHFGMKPGRVPEACFEPCLDKSLNFHWPSV